MPTFQYIGREGKGRLESALAEPRQTFGGLYLRRTICDKAAALFRSVVLNHALVDGNKRLGLATVTVFLTINGYLFYTRREDAVAFALRVASPVDRPSLAEISRWLRRHSIRTEVFRRMDRGAQLKWLGIEQQTEPYRTERLRTVRWWALSIERALLQLILLD
jgi:death-on-curing protein